jgi:hypothetical protein
MPGKLSYAIFNGKMLKNIITVAVSVSTENYIQNNSKVRTSFFWAKTSLPIPCLVQEGYYSSRFLHKIFKCH